LRPSGRKLSIPFCTREPLPHAEAEAAESVTSEFKERTFMRACATSRRVQRPSQRNPCPRVSREK